METFLCSCSAYAHPNTQPCSAGWGASRLSLNYDASFYGCLSKLPHTYTHPTASPTEILHTRSPLSWFTWDNEDSCSSSPHCEPWRFLLIREGNTKGCELVRGSTVFLQIWEQRSPQIASHPSCLTGADTPCAPKEAAPNLPPRN